MKTFWALTFGMLFSFSLAPQLSAAPQYAQGRNQNQNRDRVCVYQDIRFQGWEQCYAAGDEIPNLERRNNSISSIRVYGRARVTIYEDTNFRGRSAEFSSDVPDLGLRSLAGSKPWSDHIQSLRVSSDYNNGTYGNNSQVYGNSPVYGGNQYPNQYPSQQQLSDGVCVYDRPNYQGREQCWSAGQDLSDLGRAGNWSDRISSIRVFGPAAVVLYRDIGFRGESIVLDRDIPNLNQIQGSGFRNWDRQASSLQIENERNNGFPGRGRGRGRNRQWR